MVGWKNMKCKIEYEEYSYQLEQLENYLKIKWNGGYD